MKKGLLYLCKVMFVFGVVVMTGQTLNVKAASFEQLSIESDCISWGAITGEVQKINVDTTIKKKTVKDWYSKRTERIYLEYIKGREATLELYTNDDKTSKVILKVNAKKGKVKAKFLPKTYGVKVTVAGSEIKDHLEFCRGNSRTWQDFDYTMNFEDYTVKGATLKIRVKESFNESTNTYTPSSKEVKLRIPAKKAGPTIKVAAGTLSFVLPKGCAYYMTDGNGNSNSQIDAVSQSALRTATTVNLVKVLSSAGIDITVDDKTASCAAVFHVKKVSTDKTLETRETIIKVPFQRVLTAQEVVSSSGGMSFDYKYNMNKTQATGLTVYNRGNEDFQFAIIPSGTSIYDIDLTATTGKGKVTFTTVKAHARATVDRRFAPENATVIYRAVGVSANAYKKIPLKFASTMVSDPVLVQYPKAPASDLSVTFSKLTETVPTASGTAVTVQPYQNAPSGSYYAYDVTNVLVKNLAIGTTRSDGLTRIGEIGSAIKVPVNKNQYLNVYLLDQNHKVVAYCSKLVNESDLY